MMSNESSTTPQNHAENNREIPQDISELSYEQARDELVKTVSQLETGGAPLEESIALWERGESLAAHCENLLARAQQRLDAARPTP